MSKFRPGTVPLERALSKLGLASRTQARALILAGKVRVNGVSRGDPGFAVRPETARIEIDGERVAAAEPRYFLLNKPRGTITTRADDKGRPTVLSLLGDAGTGLHAVGRLDLATTGLLLLTNDTRLSAWLTDPAQDIPRVYLVTVRGEVTEERAGRIRAGITVEIDGVSELLRASRLEIRKASGRESHLTVELREGKNREIRRLFAACDHEVTALKRVSYGPITLGDLQPGQYRELGVAELRAAFPAADTRLAPCATSRR